MPRFIATPVRASAGAMALALVLAVVLRARRDGGAEMLAVAAAIWALGALAFWLLLRAEEARVVGELRVARAGTEVQRHIALRRRRPMGFAGALTSTRVGNAAVLLADGDATAAARALGTRMPWSARGLLGELRAVVEADLLRARGTEEALGEAIRALYNMRPLAHPEGERYRIHVLVKALLEQADGATARSVAEDLATVTDEDVRVYSVWLRAWFELGDLPAPSDPDLRRALLLARAHGAEDLVTRLERALEDGGADPCAAGVAPAAVHG